MTSVFFALQAFLYWFLAFFTGILLVILAYLTWGLYPRSREDETDKPGIEPGVYELGNFRQLLRNPVFAWVVALFGIVLLSFFLYFVVIGLYGGPVG